MRFVYFALFLLVSCSFPSKDEKSSHTTEKKLNFEASEVIDLGSGLLIKNLKFDTLSSNQRSKGINISCIIETSEQSISELNSHGYNAMLFQWTVFSGNKATPGTSNSIKDLIGQETAFNHPPFISTSGNHFFEKHISFSCLNLPPGRMNAQFKLEVFPVIFEKDTTVKQFRKIKHIDFKSISSHTFNKEVLAPQLYLGSIKILSFDVKHKPNQKFDFTLTGNGKPDLFWELSCGNELIFSGRPLKNVFRYNKGEVSPEFCFSYEDSINLSIYDFDQGPFNSKDLISEWNGTMQDLEKGKLKSFGSIKNLELISRVKKVKGP